MKKLTPIHKHSSTDKKVFGFDIETYGRENKFYMGSLVSDDFKKPYRFVFYDKKSFFDEIMTRKFRNCYIVATNLAFDFFGVFFNTDEVNNFRFNFRGSQLIGIKTYIINKEFSARSYQYDEDGKKIISKHCIRFIDTINYVFFGVKKLGKILGINKLTAPDCLGFIPANDWERNELEVYNIRDSLISYKFIRFLFDSIHQIGGVPKMTIAATSMYLFRKKYLKDSFYVDTADNIKEILKAYYGGRTEAFKQGKFENYNYYDFCSLYPTCMLKEYPDPNTHKVASDYGNDLRLIKNYEGVSKVDITTPKDLYYPLLPVRTKEKLLFPLGDFTGWYSHIELRRALELGYQINHVHKTHFYTRKIKIFNDFVNDIYFKRMEAKRNKNEIQLVYKLILNSLYGKFAEKLEKDIIQPFNLEIEDLHEIKDFERIKNYIRYTIENEPANYNIVIWSVYVTAYARLMLYEEMIRLKPIYVDTDSLITKQKTRSGLKLGDLELEYKIKVGFIVKPKFYAFKTNDKEISKIKGVSELLGFDDFYSRVRKKSDYVEFRYKKFCKFKEALRRDLKPNEIIEVIKRLEKNDSKRNFTKLQYNRLNESKPLIVSWKDENAL